METITRPGTPLRHRMLDDMRMRKFAEHTQDGYIRAVRKLAAFLGRSPDTATIEDLRRFQLHLVDAGTGPVTINATITGLKFFFDVTPTQPGVMLLWGALITGLVVLAMEAAGLTGSQLYPGSWSEWCSDPARPVARG